MIWPRVPKSGMALEEGSRVGVIGGGPAGSLFACFLLRFTRLMELEIAVDIPRALVALGVFLGAGLAVEAPAARAQEEIYVTNFSANSITVFERTASGDVGPVRVIQGPLTLLNHPIGVAVDVVHDELVVANSNGGTGITVYARSASGDAAPLRSINGQFISGVTIDPIRDEIVANTATSVLTYSRTASGAAAALRTIEGAATGIAAPAGHTLDLVHDEIFVASTNNGSIRVFSRSANGNVAPLRVIAGAATGMGGPWGVAVDLVHDELVVADAPSGSVRVYPRSANGDVAPLRVIAGASAKVPDPHGVTLDLAHDEIVAANQFGGGITVHARTTNGDVPPLRAIEGASTGLNTPQVPAVATTAPLVAAVLPNSRSVQVGALATAFAAIVNAGPGPLQHCAPTPITAVPGTFVFQTTNSANQLVGTPNTPATVAAGATQHFVLGFQPSEAFGPADVSLGFACASTNRAPVTVGVDTILLVASVSPVPDLIALAATASQDGIVDIPGPVGAGAFAVATVNAGIAGSITVRADTNGVGLPLDLTVCETGAGGACLLPPAQSVVSQIASGATPTFSVFAVSSADIPFDPAGRRLFLRFTDGGGVTRGSTSVAVRTQ